MNHLITFTILLTFLSCAKRTKKQQTTRQEMVFAETGLRVACTRTIKTLDNEIHRTHYVNKTGNGIEKDFINNLLFSISQLDDFKRNNCTKYSINTFESWDKTNKTDKCFKLEKTELIMENPGNLNVDNPIKTAITLTDFDLYLNGPTKKITLRFLNDYEVIKIIIDGNEISGLSKSIHVGLEIVITKMDSLRHRQNASRQQ